MSLNVIARVWSPGVPGAAWDPRILADQLTLSQPGPSGRLGPPNILAPPDFQTKLDFFKAVEKGCHWMSSHGVSYPGVPGAIWLPQILEDQLTLSQPGPGGRLCPPNILAPPDFQTFLRPCIDDIVSDKLSTGNRFTHRKLTYVRFFSVKSQAPNNIQSYLHQLPSGFLSKVWTILEWHKIWKNLPLLIWHYSVASNFKWKIFSKLCAFLRKSKL